MHKQQVGIGFWTQAVSSAVALVVAAVTSVWPDWIERMFGTDPDAGSGEVEWALVGVLLAVSLTLAGTAWRRWQRSTQTGWNA